MIIAQDEIYRKVQKVIGDALGVDEGEVTPDARLAEDLGADSLDYLDMAFKLEKAFGIRVDMGDLVLNNVMTDVRYVQDGRITDEGMEELRRRLPFVNLDAFDQSRDAKDFLNVFTVDTLVRFVQAKLTARR